MFVPIVQTTSILYFYCLYDITAIYISNVDHKFDIIMMYNRSEVVFF